MDEIVLKSMAKWPNVPDVFGWLKLDQRGNWMVKDQPISNPVISEFISRNYHVDDRGRWFFQNGPQRVFVALAYAPFVLRTCGSSTVPRLQTHTGIELEQITGAWLDEKGTVILRWSAKEIGSIIDRDLADVLGWFRNAAGQPAGDDIVAKALQSRAAHGSTGIWLSYASQRVPIGRVMSEQLPAKFGFDRCPQPPPGQPDC